jgi:hypothetical protein
MLDLTPKQFEHFVAYVFRRAGYGVNDVSYRFLLGVDLELCRSANVNSKVIGGVEVKRFAPDNNGYTTGGLALHASRAGGSRLRDSTRACARIIDNRNR